MISAFLHRHKRHQPLALTDPILLLLLLIARCLLLRSDGHSARRPTPGPCPDVSRSAASRSPRLSYRSSVAHLPPVVSSQEEMSNLQPEVCLQEAGHRS